MAKRQIFCVNTQYPGEEFHYVQWNSRVSLLDADIVLYHPSLGDFSRHSKFQGLPCISEEESPKVLEQLVYWGEELQHAAGAGKLVVVFLEKPLKAFYHTGKKDVSGTGRNQKVTKIVNEISSYACLPRIREVTESHGKSIRVHSQAAFLSSYWKEMGDKLDYDVYIAGNGLTPVLLARSSERLVGARIGNTLLLPPIKFLRTKEFIQNTQSGARWTDEAKRFGKRLSSILNGLSEALNSGRLATPPPVWTQDETFVLPKEKTLREKITKVRQQVTNLAKKQSELEELLQLEGGLRGLLYEQGKPLEVAIITALQILGFNAETVKAGDSEFDVVFTSPEGRFLGEAEGKDSKAINIDKLSQLERNIQEDFAREDVQKHAQGVLFGNAHRFKPPGEREEYFTAKCISGAQRSGTALVRTPDLFEPAKYLSDHQDVDYAEKCRRALFESAGKEVVFPAPPAT